MAELYKDFKKFESYSRKTFYFDKDLVNNSVYDLIASLTENLALSCKLMVYLAFAFHVKFDVAFKAQLLCSI